MRSIYKAKKYMRHNQGPSSVSNVKRLFQKPILELVLASTDCNMLSHIKHASIYFLYLAKTSSATSILLENIR